MAVTVGVLALQGGFWEHIALLHKAAAHLKSSGRWNEDFCFIEVRTPDDLGRCDALIIPGGESTTIALIAAQSGLLEPLREFVKVSRKPTWGTCAGLILLSEQANATKKGGQELIGGLEVRVHRNHFGRQIESFVADVDLPFLAESGAAASFPGVFIRAPIVEKLLPHDAEERRRNAPTEESQDAAAQAKSSDVEVLAVLPGRTKRVKGGGVDGLDATSEDVSDIVAVRQGNIIGTSFHPELTDDSRIHIWWLEQVLKTIGKSLLV